MKRDRKFDTNISRGISGERKRDCRWLKLTKDKLESLPWNFKHVQYWFAFLRNFSFFGLLRLTWLLIVIDIARRIIEIGNFSLKWFSMETRSSEMHDNIFVFHFSWNIFHTDHIFPYNVFVFTKIIFNVFLTKFLHIEYNEKVYL